ncbi:MAG: phosphatase PAP2/dual specificity phosphatase family protein [Alphaproteobacteria bacterium]
MSAKGIEETSVWEWKRGLFWLLFLGPFFFSTYGFANWISAQRGTTATFVFGWEQYIPFLPWTIIPYWSIDLFYGLSLFTFHDRQRLDRHAFRLLTAQIISITCFILFPLRLAFIRPEIDEGVFNTLFMLLGNIDQHPYNQAPSLHISLLIILWVRYAAITKGKWQFFLHVWCALVGVSVLTTYQHQFIDVPTGMLVGFICLWLWPDTGPPPLKRVGFSLSPRRRLLAFCYFAGACFLAVAAAGIGGAALWLWWGAVACFMVALAYGGLGVQAFQKVNGRLSLAASILMAPYLVAAWLNSRWWTRHKPLPNEVCDGVWLGRMPTTEELARSQFGALFDMTAELAIHPGGKFYAAQPVLDLVPPTPDEFTNTARKIENLRLHGAPVLVACALGYSRSASAVAAWLLLTDRAKTVDEAVARLKKCRPQVILHSMHQQALANCVKIQIAENNHA